MHYIMFSKMVRGLDVPHLIEALKAVGADGVDFCVRDGFPVSPSTARASLPGAANAFRAAGLVIPMVTAPTSMTDPRSPDADALFAACHAAQIPHIKLGYWGYTPGDYWKQVEDAKRAVTGFAALGAKYGVKACLHTHSGSNLGLNVSAIMQLAAGQNPAHVGVYIDPGHLALCGEPLSMCFDMAGEYLSLIAVKDSLWIKSEGTKPRRSDFLPLGAGFVDWREMLRQIKSHAYPGPLSFHSEYEKLTPDAILEQTRKDIAFMRALEREVNGS